jgi:phage terminase large subunit GpA-like protein
MNENLRTKLFEARRANLAPPPKLTLSEWSERYAVLSRESSAATGRFEPFGYQKGLWDAVTDPSITTVSVMKSARVGFTLLLNHTIAYYLSQDPSPILLVQPRIEDAESYSKTSIAPMLRDTPALQSIQDKPKARDSGQTLLEKTFLNGSSLKLIGANSPGGFRRITSRVVLFDEVDGYPAGGAGSEGDQVALGIQRTLTFWNRKIVLGSTPTEKGVSRIERAFLEGDQRRYHVSCPHCKLSQVLEWGGKDKLHGLKWDKAEDGTHLPETAFYQCRNGCRIEEIHKRDMISAGTWIASAPFKDGHASFHIWAAYSLFPNASWRNIVRQWLLVKDDLLARKTFVNTWLGESFEDRSDRILSESTLSARAELYTADVPDGVAILTSGLDVQGDRVECEVVGWGKDEESWSIAHEVFEGDPSDPALWDQIDGYLKRSWRRADGRGFTVSAACVDSGGHHTQQVYNFSKARLGRKIWAIKGASETGGKRTPVWPAKRPSAKYKASFRPIIIGTNTAKDIIRHRLHLQPLAPDKPVPGYMHFPADRDLNYFSQLVSERSVTRLVNGQSFRVWQLIPGRRNEALDLRVYAYAALCGLLHYGLKLNKRVGDVADTPEYREIPATPTVAMDPVFVTHPQQMPQQPSQPPRVIITMPKSPSASRASRYA